MLALFGGLVLGFLGLVLGCRCFSRLDKHMRVTDYYDKEIAAMKTEQKRLRSEIVRLVRIRTGGGGGAAGQDEAEEKADEAAGKARRR